MTRWLLAPVDPRPIALLRIGLGALVLADIADRLRQFHTFYTDYGMLARSDVPVALRWPSALNPFFWSGEPAAIGTVFFFGALAAACLLVGWRSRTAAVLTWAFLSALGARNELVLNGADTVMRVLAFWLIFASPGAALSVDARRGAVAAPSRAALIALQAQVAIIYAAAGLHKHGDDWLNGTAIYRVLQIGVYARSWTRALLDHPGLCAFFTYATLALELGFVPLVLSPFRRTLCRAVAIGAACALHLGIFFAMRVGNLVWVMPVALCAFVAPAWLARLVPPASPGTRAQRWTLAALVPLLLVFSDQWRQLKEPESKRGARVALGLGGLKQSWSLFAPNPVRYDIRFSAPAIARDGTALSDVLGETLPELAGPPDAIYNRWLKARTTLSLESHARYLRGVGRLVCLRWLQAHGEPLVRFTLVLHLHASAGPDESPPAEQRFDLWEQPCVFSDGDGAASGPGSP